jgi:SAM-dependent methyltransferase
MAQVASANAEAVEAWNGVLFDRFLQYRHIVTTGLGGHGRAAMDLHPPRPGQRVLDIGCGFGDASRQLAELVGPEGEVMGIDAAERFVDTARREGDEANISFEVADVQEGPLPGGFDLSFSRFGTMFFANPVPAMRNVRDALVPGGRVCMVVWRAKLENPYMYRAEKALEGFVEEPEETDEPTCGPGPFSMADADTTSQILVSAGFTDIEFRRNDMDLTVGSDLEEAVGFVMALGPAAEVIRLAGDDAERIRPKIAELIGGVLSDYQGPDGAVVAPTSTWIVSARVPA